MRYYFWFLLSDGSIATAVGRGGGYNACAKDARAKVEAKADARDEYIVRLQGASERGDEETTRIAPGGVTIS